MDKLKISIEKEIEMNPEEVASLFCSMDDLEQAAFFNHVGMLVSKWDSPFCFQMSNVAFNKTLNKHGKDIMKTIGEYSND